MPEQVSHVVGAEGVDDPADDAGQPAAADVGHQQVGEVGGQDEREEDDRVVGCGRAEGELHRDADHAVEEVEGVQVEGRPVGRVEQRGEEGVAALREGLARPPVAPVVHQGVAAVAGDVRGEVRHQRVRS